MAEVGALRVSLNLDSANFSRSMTDVNRKLRNVKSEMNLSKASGDRFGGSLEQLRGRSDTLNRALTLQRERVNLLKNQYEESVRTKGRDAKETENLATRYNNAAAEMAKTERELASVTAAIQHQTNPWNQLSQNLTETGHKFQDVGGQMKNIGGQLSMRVTAPIVGLGAAMLRTGMEFETSMSNVQALSGATGNDLQRLEDKAREMGANTSKSASEAADAMGYMALAGWDTQQMLDGIEPILRLSEAGNIDLARASDLVTDSMSALQIEVADLPKYLDMVAEASRTSNTDMDALMEAFLIAGGTFAEFNVPLDEATALLGVLANRGFKGSQAGTALNAIFVNLTSGAGQAGEAMDELGISAFDAEGNFIGLEETLLLVKEATEGMTDEQQAQYISMIAGKQHLKTFQALLAGLDDEYEGLKESVDDSTGALNNMAETMKDNAQGNIERLQSAFGELSITVSEHLLPFVSDLTEGLTDMVSKFGDLEPSTQENIIKMTALAAAIGPVVLVAGHLVTSLGSLLLIGGQVATVIGAKGGIVAGLTALTGPAALAIAAIGGLTVAGVGLYNHLTEESIPQIERFGDEVSESTQQAMGAFMDLNEEATIALNELNWSGQEVTEEMSEIIVGNFEQMGAQIVSSLEESKEEALVVMQNLFTESTEIAEEEQEEILNAVRNGYEERIETVNENNERIKEIMQEASEENRELTREEKDEINRIQQEMNENAIEYLTENEREQKVILENMERQAVQISARQAADVVKNSKEQKEQVIAEAEEQYNEAVATAIMLRDETGEISAEQAEAIISEAQRQKDESISNAEEMHEKVVSEAQKQAEGHVHHVDWETGEVLSRWQTFRGDFEVTLDTLGTIASNKWDEMGNTLETTWEAMKTTASNKVTEMKNNAAERFAEIAADSYTRFQEAKSNIMDPITEAADWVSGKLDDIKQWFSNLKLEIPQPSLPRLPRFSLTTGSREIMGQTVRYPTGFDVNWHKHGGFFDEPTIAGLGEAGKEAIVPLVGRQMDPFADAVADRMKEVSGGKNDNGENHGEIIFNEPVYIREEADIDRLVEKITKKRVRHTRGRRGQNK
ncbi:phage tail tape measure protein [Thalassobacillus sp. C254]|uniref:phage tail tape measure protein n=1 Tax=Thalassobacillus sp. C254 TaxID=1225341 RepID=UPI0006D264E0|nr:phage tail tape measure protein [Thalassobacillus sp. C254]